VHEQSFTCVDCGKNSPPTEEGETITKQHGWRVNRRNLGGIFVIEARCPECVARHRVSLPPIPGARRDR
jgi:DNA-directed RNA polymerase subunit RPC12/RpoP